jgi:hypothetical protein
VTTIELGAMEGDDDNDPAIGNSGGRVFAQGVLAQGLSAQSLWAFCLHVSARQHQAQRLNPPFYRSAAAID